MRPCLQVLYFKSAQTATTIRFFFLITKQQQMFIFLPDLSTRMLPSFALRHLTQHPLGTNNLILCYWAANPQLIVQSCLDNRGTASSRAQPFKSGMMVNVNSQLIYSIRQKHGAVLCMHICFQETGFSWKCKPGRKENKLRFQTLPNAVNLPFNRHINNPTLIILMFKKNSHLELNQWENFHQCTNHISDPEIWLKK